MSKDTRYKIAMLITNMGKGGAQRVFYDHAQYLKDHYNIGEVVFDKNEDERIYNSGLPLYSLDVKSGRGIAGKFLNLYRRVNALRLLIKKQQFDLVISHMDGANWVNVLAGKHKKILVVHGTILHDYATSDRVRKARLKWFIPKLYQKADAVVAVSEGIKFELEQFCGLKNVSAIPNFFDLRSIGNKAVMDLPLGWNPVFQNPVLITSGRLHEQKKQRFLFPVFQKLKKDFPDLKLVILGDGELRSELIDESKRLSFKTYHVWEGMALHEEYDVYFPGYVENPFSFLARSTVFAFPSGWEGFPLALCEAMISGVAVVAADCPTGPREILSPGTFDSNYTLSKAEETKFGFLMPMVDKTNFEDVWTDVIKRLLQDDNKRRQFIQYGQERMLKYDRPNIMREWELLINEILKN